jgi:hypothetical protein
VDAPPSDPAEFYLRAYPLKRVKAPGPVASAGLPGLPGLPGEFRFVHLKGNPGSEALLSWFSRVESLQPRLQVDDLVVYDARPWREAAR